MRIWLSILTLAVAAAMHPGAPLLAQRPDGQANDATYEFDIPVTTLAGAVEAFRELTGWEVRLGENLPGDSRTAWPVRGRLTAVEGLRRIVMGTSAGFELTGERAATIDALVYVLSPLNVVAEQNRGYAVGVSRTTTKTDTPLRDVPQAITVVTSDVIADQGMPDLAEVVRYVPGVTMGQGEGNRDQPTIRGIGGTADFFVDGVRDDTEYFRDLYNVERVEVPKGANALIFGRAAGGGLINRVSKSASWSPVQELSLQGGSYENRRGQADVGTAISDNLAVRVTGMYENSDSYREGFNVERYGVTPTATLVLGGGTVVRASYEFFSDERTADRGIPSFAGEPVATARETFFGDPSESYADARVHSVNGTIERQLGGNVKVRNHTRFADYDKIYQNVFPGAVNAEGTQVNISAYNNQTLRSNLFNQTDVTGMLRTGPVQHAWLVGMELGRQSTDAFRNTGYFNDAVTTLAVPVSDPKTAGVPVTFRQSATDADGHTQAVIFSGYVQDQVEITPQILAVAGVRVDNFDLEYHNNRDGSDLSRSDRMVSPRLGLILKPMAPLSFYGSYSVSYLPSSGTQFTSLNATTETLKPEQFNSYEVGWKWDPTPVLSMSGAAYQLDRTNTSAPDPNDPARTVQTGEQRSRGVELSAAGQVTDAWQVLFGYNYQYVEITSRTTAAAPGQEVPITPHHTISVWNRYQLTPSLGLGLGLLYRDEMFAAIDNTVTLPSFTRADAGVFFRVNEHLRAQINIENIFDEDYYATAHNNNNITPGGPRSLVAGLTVAY